MRTSRYTPYVLAARLTLLGGDNNVRLSPMSGIELTVWYGFKLIGVVLLGSVALNIRRLATNRSQLSPSQASTPKRATNRFAVR